ncbi:MAG: aminodeoxychorismate/anthranilate synthase component II [Armatimonadetes bacterium]|nr:aminodeoxychorismate/anthranilate synthase component II [Armatimonadota bacterium]
MILVLDNYDSFTYNLVQVLGLLSDRVEVFRNDQITLDEIRARHPGRVVISPGPGRPEDAGLSVDLARGLGPEVPVLGVCLGHQALAVAFGGEVVRAERLVHGKTSRIYHDGRNLFQGLSNPFEATRYHSLIVREESLPECLAVTAWTSDGEIMGLRHRALPLEGVQFHPESILTGEGPRLLRNFLELV